MITFPQHTYMFIYSTTDLGKINVVTSNSISLSHFPCRISVRVLRRRRRGGRAQQQVQHRPGGAGGADQGQQDYREADQEGQAEVQVKKIRKKNHFDPCSSPPLCNGHGRFSSNFDYLPGLAFCISLKGGGVQALCIIAPNLLLPFLHGYLVFPIRYTDTRWSLLETSAPGIRRKDKEQQQIETNVHW